MKRYNITIIGAGSGYTPGVVNSLLEKKDKLPLERITLIDSDDKRLHIIGDFMDILIKERAPEVELVLTTDRKKAFKGMDFLLAQIRSGCLKMRSIDEKIPMKYGVIGQETCGPGGFAFAMREIPEMVSIAKDVVKYAPDAWIINYSNPTAIIAEAIKREVPEVKSICICDVPPWQQKDMALMLDSKKEDFEYTYFGLNHLGWFTHMHDKDGKDRLPGLINMIKETGLKADVYTDPYWEKTAKRLKQFVGHFDDVLPTSYLQYYYYPDEMFEDEDPNYTRADYCMDHREKETFDLCRKGVKDGTAKGNVLTDTIHGDFIVDIAAAIANNSNEKFIVNVPNDGVISNFSSDSIIECTAVINATGYQPIAIGEIPTFQKGLMEVVNAYEKLTVDAALEGSYQKALKALTLNPIIPSIHVAKKILDDYIEANKGYFPELS
ncbi:6-phospho-alpha-glucosidase [Clostridium sediminicola]|uniref:family 4 glycosyl hydrolase n=1 Tax=Clostridium sediminicola TaxID=3114879 RepID=UPI0031F226FD